MNPTDHRLWGEAGFVAVLSRRRLGRVLARLRGQIFRRAPSTAAPECPAMELVSQWTLYRPGTPEVRMAELTAKEGAAHTGPEPSESSEWSLVRDHRVIE